MKIIIAISLVALIALTFVPQIELAHAQLSQKVSKEKYVNLRVEVWNLFFRMTTAAFVVGSVVSGTMIWLVWRFRESNPKNKEPTKWERFDDPTAGSYEEESH